MMTTYERKSMTKGLMLGALTGGALGAGLALLFAPTSGREVRRQMRTTVDDVVRTARTAGERTRNVGQAARAAYRTFRDEVAQPAAEPASTVSTKN